MRLRLQPHDFDPFDSVACCPGRRAQSSLLAPDDSHREDASFNGNAKARRRELSADPGDGESVDLSLSLKRERNENFRFQSEILSLSFSPFTNLAAARATSFRNPNPLFLRRNRVKENGHGRLRVSKVVAKSAKDKRGG